VSDITLISTYTLGENYEILREPGKPEKHTLYVRGLHGDLVAQWTREDATLQIAAANEVISSESSISVFGSFVGRTIVGTPTDEDGSKRSRISLFVGVPTNPFCKDVAIDCGTYYKNRFRSEFFGIFGYSKYFQVGVPTSHYNVFYYLLLLGILYLSYPYFLKGNELLIRLGWKGVGTPTLILSLFVATSLPGCGILPGTGGKQGDPPWVLALGANVTPGVPSIQNPGVGMTGGGSVGGVPVTGMFFFHPDHLGSITMITDGAGNPASGPEPGTSFVSYEPYGSIIRNDSYGPDIFRYKFTGQIEDKETGLYYYKARYYDPILGRFIQPDSIADQGIDGTNRYMYVGGDPIDRTDPTGHSWFSSHLAGPFKRQSKTTVLVHKFNKEIKSFIHSANNSFEDMQRGVDHGAKKFFEHADKLNHNVKHNSKKQFRKIDHTGRKLMKIIDHHWRAALKQNDEELKNLFGHHSKRGENRKRIVGCVSVAVAIFALTTGEGVVYGLANAIFMDGSAFASIYYSADAVYGSKECLGY
ncbi:RHS repeat-associated core domain-containing protein, partial [Leptospira santarosai]|uniref:RHS repeat-associated core domain-containing protein n=2 Tax=Leptospira santarosai TaxID=28183 RepID=UPI0024AEFA64